MFDRSKMQKKIFLSFRLAELVNSSFTWIIFSQLTSSVLVLCVCTYNLSQLEATSTEYKTLGLFTLCMLIQIFYYTWNGNEITLKVFQGFLLNLLVYYVPRVVIVLLDEIEVYHPSEASVTIALVEKYNFSQDQYLYFIV